MINWKTSGIFLTKTEVKLETMFNSAKATAENRDYIRHYILDDFLSLPMDLGPCSTQNKNGDSDKCYRCVHNE